MDLFLIRHGQSTGNAVGPLDGSMDPPLTDLGLRQARCAALRLAEISPDVAFCGPLLRNLQTAQCVFEETDLRPKMLWSLFEIGANQFVREWDEIRSEFPFLELEDELPPPRKDRAETSEQSFERARALINWVRGKYEATDSRVALVSHGTLNGSVISACFGLGPSPYNRFSSGNGSIHWLELKPDWTKARKLNDECHIPESERT